MTELSLDLGLTKSNAFRLLGSPTTPGYVEHRDDKTYAATLQTGRVGRASVEGLNLRDFAEDAMTRQSQETGEAIYLAVPENLSVVYIDKVDSQKPIRSWNTIGGMAPMHCVAADYARRRDQIAGALTRATDRTITDCATLDADIALPENGVARLGGLMVGAARSVSQKT